MPTDSEGEEARALHISLDSFLNFLIFSVESFFVGGVP